jgi:hypothetical protein
MLHWLLSGLFILLDIAVHKELDDGLRTLSAMRATALSASISMEDDARLSRAERKSHGLHNHGVGIYIQSSCRWYIRFKLTKRAHEVHHNCLRESWPGRFG